MYRGKLWTMRQYAGFGSAASTNERFKFLLAGRPDRSVVRVRPADADGLRQRPPACRGRGRQGRRGHRLDRRHAHCCSPTCRSTRSRTSMTINSTGAILLLMYELVAEEQGVPSTAISGTIQNDLLKEYIARGTYMYPPKPSMRIITNIFEYCAQHVPKWNTISISGYHIREAGSHGRAGDRVHHRQRHRLRRRGHRRRPRRRRRSRRGSASSGTRTTTSSKRSPSSAPSRRIWYRLMTERFGAKKESSKLLRFHTQTGGSHAHRAAAGEQHRARRRADRWPR